MCTGTACDAFHLLRQRRRRRQTLRGGFTLVEASIVMVIVGVGIMGMLQLLAAGTMANGDSTELTTAIGLASNLHEYSLGVKYDQILTLDAHNYSPPVDGRLAAINGLTGWTQQITVDYVNPDNVTATVAKTPAQPIARITVTISHNGRLVYVTNWLASALTWG